MSEKPNTKRKRQDDDDDSLISFNVSDRRFYFFKSTIEGWNLRYFSALIDGNFKVARDDDGSIILDKDPLVFEKLTRLLCADEDTTKQYLAVIDIETLIIMKMDAMLFCMEEQVKIITKEIVKRNGTKSLVVRRGDVGALLSRGYRIDESFMPYNEGNDTFYKVIHN